MGENIYITKAEYDFYYPVVYYFPKRYEYSFNSIVELFSQYDRVAQYDNRFYVEKSELYRVEDPTKNIQRVIYQKISSRITPRWVLRFAQGRAPAGSYGSYRFFLLDREIVFDYFIREWEKDSTGQNDISYIKESYNELCKLAIRERDEEIIREII